MNLPYLNTANRKISGQVSNNLFADKTKGEVVVLEVAILDVKPDQQKQFEQAFQKAQAIICASSGYISHQMQKCIEKNNRYILLVNWESLEDHTEGFRGSKKYKEWSALLHHFYDPFPEVEHYLPVENVQQP